MNNEPKVLACVDRSHFADTVADAAAWAAARLAAPLEFLHVIERHPEIGSGEDHSGAIGFDAQEQLLKTLSERDAERAIARREEGRVFLNRLRERALAAGAAGADVRQRYGELEESLAEQESAVRLFVLGRRGESAETTPRDLGRNVERVVRTLHQPILTVSENFTAPQRFMVAFDGGAVTRRGIEMIAVSPLFQGMSCHVLMSGKASADAEKHLAWATTTLEQAGFAPSVQHTPGDAETVIAQAVQEHNIDLLVMGAFNHSPLRSLIFGSRTNDLLRASRIPTLLLR